MVRVPHQVLTGWIATLDCLAASLEAGESIPHSLADELHRIAAEASALLTHSTDTARAKRKGLGKGLEALIPAGGISETDVDGLRERLRRIAADVEVPNPAED